MDPRTEQDDPRGVDWWPTGIFWAEAFDQTYFVDDPVVEMPMFFEPEPGR